MSWRSRLMNVFRSARVERELDEEQRFHLEARTADLMRAGLSRREAEAQAARQFGGRLRLREASRDVKLAARLESLLKDVRFGVRLLRKDAILSGAAIASLALAIGACTAAFSLIDALILRPLPVHEPDRLIFLTYPHDNPAIGMGESFSVPILARLREAARPHAALFLLSSQPRQRAIFDATGQDEQVRAQFVSGDAFSRLGLAPALGRLIGPSDEGAPGESAVAVLSHAFWQRRFGGDPTVIGRTFTFRQRQFQIVGVAREGFTGTEPGILTDLWVPASMYDPRAFTNFEFNWFKIFGRLHPGASRERLEAVVSAAFMNARREFRPFRPGMPRDRVERFHNTPLLVRSAANGPSSLRRTFERPLWVLAAVVGLVLLIAASNVANLLIARAAAREREMSLRLSIGAGRGRLVQQVLVESSLLAGAACVLGVIVAAVAAPAIVRMLAPATDPAYLDLRVSWRLIAFAGAMGLLTTLVFGLAPALRASRVAAMDVLKGGGRTLTSRRGFGALVATQVAFSLVVLFVASLLLLSFGRLMRVDAGFNTSHLLLAGIEAREPRGTPEQVRIAVQQLLDRVRQMPGVQQAALTAFRIFGGGGWTARFPVAGRPQEEVDATIIPSSPGFIETLGLRVLEGRTFTPDDTLPDPTIAVVVNESFARRVFGTVQAVGRTFQRPDNNRAVPAEIVGVVSDAKYDTLRDPAPPTVYLPLRGPGTLYVRTAGDPLALAPALRREIERDPQLRVMESTLQTTVIANTLLRERLLALLSGFFAIVGLLLAAVGLYGVLSYAVVQRTREIGIRVALGARPAGVIRAVLVRIVWMMTIGILAGLGGGLFLSRFVEAVLYDVRALDLWSIALPVVGLLAAAALAAIPPARRAARVDPVVALRYE